MQEGEHGPANFREQEKCTRLHSSITISCYVHPSKDAVLAAMSRLGGRIEIVHIKSFWNVSLRLPDRNLRTQSAARRFPSSEPSKPARVLCRWYTARLGVACP